MLVPCYGARNPDGVAEESQLYVKVSLRSDYPFADRKHIRILRKLSGVDKNTIGVSTTPEYLANAFLSSVWQRGTA